MNQFTPTNAQSEAFMQSIYANGGPNLLSMPPEMQSLTAQQLSSQQQHFMSQPPQIYGQSGVGFGVPNAAAAAATMDQAPQVGRMVPSNMLGGQQQQQQLHNPMMPPPPQQQQHFRPTNLAQQQAWFAKQQLVEQRRRQLLMIQQQQQQQMQQQQMQKAMQAPGSSSTPGTAINQAQIPVSMAGGMMNPGAVAAAAQGAAMHHPMTPNPSMMTVGGSGEADKSKLTANDLNAKRVETILIMNQELIRLCIQQQQNPQEPDIGPYQARLQSNLTYLATMADISMVKPGDETRTPNPPDLSPLPTPIMDSAKKIHSLLAAAQMLFKNDQEPGSKTNGNSEAASAAASSPYSQTQSLQHQSPIQQQQTQNHPRATPPSQPQTPQQQPQTPQQQHQQMLRQHQAAQRQHQSPQQPQQFYNGAPMSMAGSPAVRSTMVDPQTLMQQQQLRQQQQQQQRMMGMPMGIGADMMIGGDNGYSQVHSGSPMSQSLDALSPSMSNNPTSIPTIPSSLNPSDLMINGSGIINPAMVMNNATNMNMMGSMYGGAGAGGAGGSDDMNNYQDVVMMMQRLQQQQQQQQHQQREFEDVFTNQS